MTELCGTHDDILIPSSCLNSTVSGLISRTFLRSDIIGKDDFHGAVYYGELKDSDLSYEFIHTIENEFEMDVEKENKCVESSGIDEVKQIAKTFDIDDINLIKPGIGEATRVLLRRVPWKILIDERYKGDPQLGHLVRLAEEKNVSIQYYPMKHYKCCGIIKKNVRYIKNTAGFQENLCIRQFGLVMPKKFMYASVWSVMPKRFVHT